jgi:hypothetical protein
LEASLNDYAVTGTHNAELTREIGLPLIHALRAFRCGNFARTVDLLVPIRGHIKEIGGSNAQRDLFTQALVIAALRSGQWEVAQQVIAERKTIKVGSPRAFAPYLRSPQTLSE